MEKNVWCFLLLTITLPCLPLTTAQEKQTSWWQSRTDIEKGLIIAACTLATTLVVGAGVQKSFSSKGKERAGRPKKLITKSVTDFSPLTEKEYEECYLILPKTKSLRSKVESLVSPAQTKGKVFLINESGGNSQYSVKEEEVDIIPLDIAFFPHLKQIQVLETCLVNNSQLIFFRGEAASLQKTEGAEGDYILSKELKYDRSGEIAEKGNVPKGGIRFPCIRVANYDIIVPRAVARVFKEKAHEPKNQEFKGAWV